MSDNNENEVAQKPIATLAEATGSPAPTETATTPTPAPSEPAAATKPQVAPGRGDPRGGDRGRRPGGGGGGGRFPRKEKAPRPPVEDIRPMGEIPKMHDLDKEIADEMDAALSAFGEKDWMGIDSSAQAQKQAHAGTGHEKKQATVHSVRGKDVFVDIPGGRSQGVLAVEQFPDGPPKPGDVVDVNIEGYDNANGLLILTRKGSAVVVDWSIVAEGMTVEARVIETNKGGLSVEVNGLRGFMPISQIDLYRVDNVEQYVNQKLICIVTEARPEEKNLVVSRRAILEKEKEEKREKLWAELAEGQIRDGVVRNIREFGAFVDIGGVDGLLPLGEMSWQRVNDPNKIVQLGQSVKVMVLRLDHEARKVLLGLRQLETSPWDNIEETFPVHSTVKGTVVRTLEFGAIVELDKGIEGMIHISEMARNRIWRVTDVVKVGQEVDVKVLSIDKESKRIALSLKALIPTEKPKAAEPEEEAEPEKPEKVKPVKPRTTPLKGGTGPSGPLFSMQGDQG